MNDYSIKSTLGRGSEGSVHLCECQKKGQEGKKYAMKRIIVSNLEDANKIIKELLVMKDLPPHPNLVNYHDLFFEEKDDFYVVCIVMDYFELGDLGKYVTEYMKTEKKRLPEETVLKIVEQLAKGISFLHNNNVLHRDIKAENSFMTKVKKRERDEADFIVKVGDFGFTTKFSTGDSVRSSFLGSPAYIAPELFKGEKYSFKVDLFSLGVLLYKLSTGNEKKFQVNLFQNQKKVRDQIRTEICEFFSKEYIQLMFRLLEVDPAKRYDGVQTLDYVQKMRRGEKIEEEEFQRPRIQSRDTETKIRRLMKLNYRKSKKKHQSFPRSRSRRAPDYSRSEVTVLELTIGNSFSEVKKPKMGTCGYLNRYKWTFFVRLNVQYPQDYIKSVAVTLHESFKEGRIVMNETPFEFSRTGWGVFLLPVEVKFSKSSGLRDMDLVHTLSLTGAGAAKTYKLKFKL